MPTGQVTGDGAKCVDVTGSGTADGTAVILYTCGGTVNQRWTQPGDGTFRSLGKCLTAGGSRRRQLRRPVDLHGRLTQSWTSTPTAR